MKNDRVKTLSKIIIIFNWQKFILEDIVVLCYTLNN
jgi:hypothetical protein